MPGACAACDKPAATHCTLCKNTRYCSRECQSRHWPTHKLTCSPGCSHYKRKCALVSPCCNGVFYCRFCHDQKMYDEETDPKKSHKLDRHAVTHVVCWNCGLKQRASPYCGGSDINVSAPAEASVSPSPSEVKTGCGERFAAYCCLVCNLFDDEGLAKQVFHCKDCGICRVGGRDAYFHCQRCNACYPKTLEANHSCVEQSLQRNCPVCQEDMFSSRISAQVLACGHTMHSTCLESFTQAGAYKCPTCNRTLLQRAEARALWAQLREEVFFTPMPAEYATTVVQVLCNDCNQKSSVNFHVIGHECSHCHSFNTVKE